LVLGSAVPSFIAAGAQLHTLAWLRWLLTVAAKRGRRRIMFLALLERTFPLELIATG
jgi:hypothetical protein